MNTYNKEQIEALHIVREGLKLFSSSAVTSLKDNIQEYFFFREEVDAFFLEYFSQTCTQKCFESQTSACCGRDGITTFFADVVINALVSECEELDRLEYALQTQGPLSTRCVYLGPKGCLWQVKPIVCEMFLCRPAKDAVFDNQSEARETWSRLKEKEKRFTWPSRPVLFEYFEHIFLKKGFNSSIMYFHNSPGLLRVRSKRKQQGNNRSKNKE